METAVLLTGTPNRKTRLKIFWENLNIKTAAQHVGLLITLMAYTVAGGVIFRELEYPAELEKINLFNVTLSSTRRSLIRFVYENDENSTNFEGELRNYEQLLLRAFEAGVSVDPEEQIVKWTILRAVFFSSTVLTTIGYGNITPETIEGRIFCIVFALVGIPLTLTVIADWGKVFAHTASSLVQQGPSLPNGVKGALVRRTTSYAFLAVCFLFLYLAIGAAVFVVWEEDWSFFEGFYFCFITMTTIGFGDLVPKQPAYMLLCTLYILVGLALTSTIIELVRSQYAQSWKQLRALHGPLADHLRKIADNAPGLDVLSIQQDFMKVITAVSVPKKLTSSGSTTRKSKINVTDWEDAMEAALKDMIKSSNSQTLPPVVQFIIYETSV